MKKTLRTAVLSLTLALALSACQNVKQELGVGRQSPDEFAVVKRAPLTMPPDYALRPPSDGSDVSSASVAASQARTALLGDSGTTVTASTADDAFLQKLGTDKADPSIRSEINKENGYIALKNESVADKLIFWKDDPAGDQTPASVVDSAKEAERLKKDQADGKPVTGDDVPVIEKKQSAIDKIF